MADWFKFYENDLDETRFQYAIHQLVEVCPVWVGILSECCRHKSDTIRWGNNEIELFGFSQRLNVSVPKVNEAIKLLVDIDYISKGENTLKVLKWRDKQSDYCQRLKRATPDSVRTVSGQCSSRGEESRGEEKILVPSPVGSELKLEVQEASKPETDDQWLDLLQKSEAYRTLDVKEQFSRCGFWCQEKKKKLTRNRFLYWLNKADKPIQANGNGQPPQVNGAQMMSWNQELGRVIVKMEKIVGQYGDHQSWDQRDKTRFAELGARKKELKNLIGAKE